MWQLSRQNISRKLKGRTFFEPEHLPFEKKTGPRKIGTQDFCHPRRIHYHQGKCARDTKCIMNQCTTRSPMDKDVYGKKKSSTRLQYPCYRKDKMSFQSCRFRRQSKKMNQLCALKANQAFKKSGLVA